MSIRFERGNGSAVALIVAAALFGALLNTPAGAHVGGSAGHLWSEHMLPLAKKTFHTKAQSDRRFIQAEKRTGFLSCPASAFTSGSNSNYATSDGLRYMVNGSDTFYCNPALPNKASLVAIRFTWFDNSTTGFNSCGFRREDLVTGQDLSVATVFGDATQTPGLQRISLPAFGWLNNRELRITDNERFVYVLWCQVTGAGNTVGFKGASIEYTITGAQGASS